jgi:hypothetical protein
MKRILVSAKQVEEMLGLSDRHRRRLTEQAVLPEEEGGGFDLLLTVRRYLAHAKVDVEGKQARTELAKVEAKRKRVQAAREAANLPTVAELTALVAELWGAIWSAQAAATSSLYWACAALSPQGFPEHKLRAAIGEADELAKGELRLLREQLDQRMKGFAGALQDPARIEALLEKLADEAHGEKSQ